MHHENYTTNFTLLAVQLLILPKLNNEYIYIYTYIRMPKFSNTVGNKRLTFMDNSTRLRNLKWQ